MMPDLGQYASAVLSAYLVGGVLLIALGVQSILRANKTRRELNEIEARRKKNA